MSKKTQDASLMAERREKLLETGFQMFAEHSIEAVKLQDIANKCGIGIATLYRYFGTKPDLVIEIATRLWHKYYSLEEQMFQACNGNDMTAAEELEYFLDCFIDLYKNHKDILRFNRNFDTYVKHEGCTEEQMRPYNEAVSIFANKFHLLFLKAQKDKTLDVSMSEKKFFINLLYIMLSVTGKYAEGLIYPYNYEQDMTEELYMLKHMILNTYVKPMP
ncbi:MAG: TetR/AcrR family transcriptional regulator [Proteobacteria bacterium]|nr:TetR/AcrR family transcriptional regulator [Pseudomonadota bacterium]